jgi:2-(1,2-epoxy-1,2-dihydrophenyl)acetyl-CoA isomerase
MLRMPDDQAFLIDLTGGVLRLTFNRPEFSNAISREMVPLLIELFRNAQITTSVRCILVAGSGTVFSAGGDVAGFAKSLYQGTEVLQADFAGRLSNLKTLVEAVVAFDRPIVAVVRGAAAGAGLLYPLVADFVIGDESAAFVFAHQRVGLSPDGGVTSLLPLAVGARMARMLLLTAANVNAAEALRLGILHQIVPADTLEEESLKVAQRFSRAPQQAIVSAKRLIGAAAKNDLTAQLDAETREIVACVGDPDFAEGVRAFVEKRKAIFPSTRD